MPSLAIINSALALSAAAVFLTGAIMATPSSAQSESTTDAAITQTMMRYQDALNASSTPQVMQLYTQDGVFMPPNRQPAVGKTEVQQAYDAVFKRITLRVKFHIDEIVQMSPDWAFVRTNSAGTQITHTTNAKTAEANSELFILRKKSDGVWRIARYSFSPSNPGSCT
jgi:uncharacterized protein (TIGR02246 family)